MAISGWCERLVWSGILYYECTYAILLTVSMLRSLWNELLETCQGAESSRQRVIDWNARIVFILDAITQPHMAISVIL